MFQDTERLPRDSLHPVSLDAGGILWAATQDGAAYYDGRMWTAVPLPERAIEDDFIRCVLGASDGSVWFGTRSNGWYRLENGTWTHLARRDRVVSSRELETDCPCTAGAPRRRPSIPKRNTGTLCP